MPSSNSKLSLNQKLIPAETALIVVDIQIDFCSPKGVLGKRSRDFSLMDPMIDKLEKVIDCAQEKGIFTAYTQEIYDRTKLTPLQLEQFDLDGKLVLCDIKTEGYRFYRLKPPPENVFAKYDFNIFSNPSLHQEFQNRGIKTLIITGVDSQTCVETAIRIGFDLGYKIVVPKDLIATNAKRILWQKRTLELVNYVYGVVSTSEEVLNIWKLG